MVKDKKTLAIHARNYFEMSAWHKCGFTESNINHE